MTNDVTKTTGTAVAVIDDDIFAEVSRGLGARSMLPFLGFNGNTGDFTFGKKDAPTEVPHGTQFVANMWDLEHGFICWKEGKPVDTQLWPIKDVRVLPPITQLPDHGPYREVTADEQEDGWRKMVRLTFYVFDCESADIPKGKALSFNPSSKSPVQAMADLVFDYSKQFKLHPGQFPVIEINAEGYQAKVKRAGKKFACKLTIVGWIDADEFNDIKGMAGEHAENEDDADAAGANDAGNYEQTTTATATPPAEPVKQPEPTPAPVEAKKAEPAPTAAPVAPAATGAARRERRF